MHFKFVVSKYLLLGIYRRKAEKQKIKYGFLTDLLNIPWPMQLEVSNVRICAQINVDPLHNNTKKLDKK